MLNSILYFQYKTEFSNYKMTTKMLIVELKTNMKQMYLLKRLKYNPTST